MRGLDEWNGVEAEEVRGGCYYSGMAQKKCPNAHDDNAPQVPIDSHL